MVQAKVGWGVVVTTKSGLGYGLELGPGTGKLWVGGRCCIHIYCGSRDD